VQRLRCKVKRVVDLSALGDPALEHFLTASRANIAVFIDYAAMEAYKSADPLQALSRYVSIVANHPDQVLVLKGTRKIVALKPRRKGLHRRLVDEDQTRDFPLFCRQVELARAGDRRFDRAIQEHRSAASDHLEKILRDSTVIAEGLELLQQSFTRAELESIRGVGQYTSELVEKMVKHVMMLAAILFRDHPDRIQFPKELRQAVYTYVFRYALCGYLTWIRRLKTGAISNVSPETTRNDIVDMSYVAYATFFDGLLTCDKRMEARYQEACAFLKIIWSE
jgi:hypothetical protein